MTKFIYCVHVILEGDKYRLFIPGEYLPPVSVILKALERIKCRTIDVRTEDLVIRSVKFVRGATFVDGA